MEKFMINDVPVSADTIEFNGVSIMLIKSGKGALGCAYLNLAAADKFGHALAIVSGVKNYEDMLAAEVKSVSAAAAGMGVMPGMSGKEALLKMS